MCLPGCANPINASVKCTVKSGWMFELASAVKPHSSTRLVWRAVGKNI